MLLRQGEDLSSCITEKLHPYPLTKRLIEQRNRREQRRGVAEPLIYGARVPNPKHFALIPLWRRLREVLLRITVIDNVRRFTVTPAQLFCQNRGYGDQRCCISYHE